LSYANPDTADVDFIAQFPGQNRAGQIDDTSTGAAGSSLPEQVLSLLSNAILGWNTVHISDIVTRLQGKGPNYLAVYGFPSSPQGLRRGTQGSEVQG